MLGVPALFGRVAGCHSVPLLWPPLLLSKIYTCMVAAAGILLWRRGSFVVLVCVEGVWLPWSNWDVFNVVHSRCWCPLYHVITLDRHCVCRTGSISIQCRGVDCICCEVAV